MKYIYFHFVAKKWKLTIRNPVFLLTLKSEFFSSIDQHHHELQVIPILIDPTV